MELISFLALVSIVQMFFLAITPTDLVHEAKFHLPDGHYYANRFAFVKRGQLQVVK